MAGLVPAIHVSLGDEELHVDARDKPAHDESLGCRAVGAANLLFFAVSDADLQGRDASNCRSQGFSTRIGAPFTQAAMSSTAPP
jgi:hypothetical protein